MPTSVLLAVLAAAGLLALAPALTRRYDATERVEAERATSTARVLSRRRRRRTVPGRRPVNPARFVPAPVFNEHEHESRTRFRAYKFYARRRALLLQKLQNFLWMSFRVLNRRPVTQNFAVGTDHDGRANGSFYSLTFGVFPLSPRAVGPHDFDLWIR